MKCSKLVTVQSLVLSLTILLSLLVTFFVPKAVQAAHFEEYKPETKQEEADGFSKLQEINPDVLGWINVYGTHIDYPLLQADDNKKYLDKDSEGNYSITGSIFLDYRSNGHFDDFNTIIYGHHVDSGVIFGDIKKFADNSFFDQHKYGSIYYNGKERGLEIFALLEVDAYDFNIYQPGVTGDKEKNEYYQYLLASAKHKRNVSISSSDQIVLLSTCFVDVTNGRHILLAKVTDEVHRDNLGTAETGDVTKEAVVAPALQYLETVPLMFLYILIVILIVLIIILIILIMALLRREKKVKDLYLKQLQKELSQQEK